MVSSEPTLNLALTFVRQVNEFLDEQNLGWQLQTIPIEGTHLRAPQVIIRGNDAFERAVSSAAEALDTANRNVAKRELEEALHDLSRRPEPDLTGAMHHAMAALECVATDICGEPGETLGRVIKRHPDCFPAPLGDVMSKLYGFASDRGRHVTEGKGTVNKTEAELIVTIAAAATTYLLAQATLSRNCGT